VAVRKTNLQEEGPVEEKRMQGAIESEVLAPLPGREFSRKVQGKNSFHVNCPCEFDFARGWVVLWVSFWHSANVSDNDTEPSMIAINVLVSLLFPLRLEGLISWAR